MYEELLPHPFYTSEDLQGITWNKQAHWGLTVQLVDIKKVHTDVDLYGCDCVDGINDYLMISETWTTAIVPWQAATPTDLTRIMKMLYTLMIEKHVAIRF